MPIGVVMLYPLQSVDRGQHQCQLGQQHRLAREHAEELEADRHQNHPDGRDAEQHHRQHHLLASPASLGRICERIISFK